MVQQMTYATESQRPTADDILKSDDMDWQPVKVVVGICETISMTLKHSMKKD